MNSTLTLRMFIAGILLKTEDNSMYFNDLYDKFVTDFFQRIRCFYSPQMLFMAAIGNEDEWFNLIPFRPLRDGEVDVYCHISITHDIRKLEDMRTRFLLSQDKTRQTAPPSLREFIDSTINILNQKLVAMRFLPQSSLVTNNNAQLSINTSMQDTMYDYTPDYQNL